MRHRAWAKILLGAWAGITISIYYTETRCLSLAVLPLFLGFRG